MPADVEERRPLLEEGENSVVDSICRRIIDEHFPQASKNSINHFFRGADKILATPAGLAMPSEQRQATNLVVDALSGAFVKRNFSNLNTPLQDLQHIIDDASQGETSLLRSYIARTLGLNDLTKKLRLFAAQNPTSDQARLIKDLFEGLKNFSAEIAEIVQENNQPMTVVQAQSMCSKVMHASYTGIYTVASVLASASGGLGGLALLKNINVFDTIPTFEDEWYSYVPNLILGLIGLTVWYVYFMIFRKAIYQMKWFGSTIAETVKNFMLNIFVGLPLAIFSSLPSVKFTADNFRRLLTSVQLNAPTFLTTMAQASSLTVNASLGLNVVRELAAIGSAFTSYFCGLQFRRNWATLITCGIAALAIIGSIFAVLLPYLSFDSQFPEGWFPASWQSLSGTGNLVCSVVAGVINGGVGMGPALRGAISPFTIFQPRFSMPEKISGIVIGCMSVLIFGFFINEAVLALFPVLFINNPVLANAFLYALEILGAYLNFSVYSVLPKKVLDSFRGEPDYRLPPPPESVSPDVIRPPADAYPRSDSPSAHSFRSGSSGRISPANLEETGESLA